MILRNVRAYLQNDMVLESEELLTLLIASTE